MKRLAAALLWTLIFVALLGVLDRFLVTTPTNLPVAKELRTFYLDFRGRLVRSLPQEQKTLEAVIEKTAAEETVPAENSPRYLYADGNGELRFADTLEEVPAQFRQGAQVLSR